MSEADDGSNDVASIEDIDFESADVQTLTEANYESSIKRVSTLESKMEQVHSALGHVHTMESAVEDIQDECGVSSLEDLSPTVNSEYVALGQRIFAKLNDEDTLLTASDKPSSWTDDFETYSEEITAEYQRLQRLEQEYDNLSKLKVQLEDYPGDNVEEAEEILKNRKEDFEHAKHLLELKGGQCSVCGVEWQNLVSDRKTEVEEQIEKYQSKYGEDETDFTAEFVKTKLDSTKNQIGDLNDLKSDIERAKSVIQRLEDRDTEELDTLVEKHLAENN